MPLPSQREAAPRPDSGIFTILTVCTGNICRSPQAEQLLRARIPRVFGRSEIPALRVVSAGSMGLEGSPMDAPALEQAVRMGVLDGEAHVARRLRAPHVLEADLVLGLSREHRGAAVSLEPAANRRAFTLAEFARIIVAMAAGELAHDVQPLGERGFSAFMHEVTASAARLRGQLPPVESQDQLDIVDPYRLAPEVYRASADAVEATVDRIARALLALASRG